MRQWVTAWRDEGGRLLTMTHDVVETVWLTPTAWIQHIGNNEAVHKWNFEHLTPTTGDCVEARDVEPPAAFTAAATVTVWPPVEHGAELFDEGWFSASPFFPPGDFDDSKDASMDCGLPVPDGSLTHRWGIGSRRSFGQRRSWSLLRLAAAASISCANRELSWAASSALHDLPGAVVWSWRVFFAGWWPDAMPLNDDVDSAAAVSFWPRSSLRCDTVSGNLAACRTKQTTADLMTCTEVTEILRVVAAVRNSTVSEHTTHNTTAF